jgi:Rrf2 family protein
MQGILRHTDYALRVVFHLAALGAGARVQVKDIAERRLMPAPFVRRVVARLAANGILSTVRGSGGGVRLARPADAISLLDVVRATRLLEEHLGSVAFADLLKPPKAGKEN